MNLELIAAPTGDIVTLDEAKAHLRVPTSDEDALITALVAVATEQLDGRRGALGRALLTQTWRARFDRFPRGRAGFELPFPPLQEVVSIKYLDQAGAEQTMPPADYVVETDGLIGRVFPAYDKCWPATRAERNAVRIEFKAGYGDQAADVPESLKHAIKLMVGDGYCHRETVAAGNVEQIPMSLAVVNLISNYRISIAS